MPTPFSHLAFAQRLRGDDLLPPSVKTLLQAQWSAFLLGSIAADGHGLAGIQREDTHFYAYDRPMEDHPWRVMVGRYPTLLTPSDAAQQAFVAGYVAHISMDEVWSLDMLRPHFAEREWASRPQRFLMLHILLILMDERDEQVLAPSIADELHAAEPHEWSPFMSDSALKAWGELVDRQIMPGGKSETLTIFGGRIGKTPEELRAVLDSPDQLELDLWANIPRSLLADIEAQMYSHARDQMLLYLSETGL